MHRDYLLESNGIQAKDLKKIYSDDQGRWIIELKAPKQGYCPVCKTRSRSRKTYGFHRIQGIGSQNLPVTIILPWVCFYCRDPHCPPLPAYDC